MAVRCYESHPVIKLGKGKLYGGSASHPAVKDADVYVSLQHGSTSNKVSDPWDTEKSVVEVQYSINDMTAPSNVPRFKKMVTWICNQLHDGKTVHVGCMGGHGRTGVVLSAIVAEMKEKKDAIQWVRKHYCKKAVESDSQIKFLMKHYDVSEVEPSKEYKSSSSHKGATTWDSISGLARGLKGYAGAVNGGGSKKLEEPDWVKDSFAATKLVPEGVTAKTRAFPAMASSRSLWKSKRKK